MSASSPAAWINGEPASRIDIGDRGLSYGDGVFETMLCTGRRVPLIDRHLNRMEQSCEVLSLPFSRTEWQQDIDIALSAVTTNDRCVIKLQHTRGSGGAGYQPDASAAPTRIVQQKPYPSNAADRDLRCAVLDTRLGTNPMLAGHKHLNRMEQVLAAQELSRRGMDEGLVCDLNGFVIEGVSANLLLVFDDRIVTPRLDMAGVNGVMRALLMERCREDDIPIKEEYIFREAAEHADELILCNSVRGVRRVALLGERVLTKRGVFTRLQALAEEALRVEDTEHGH